MESNVFDSLLCPRSFNQARDKSLVRDGLRINRRYGAPLILAMLLLAVTVYSASQMFHHQLKAPSTTAGFLGNLSSNCAVSSITSNPSKFSTNTLSTIYLSRGVGPILPYT